MRRPVVGMIMVFGLFGCQTTADYQANAEMNISAKLEAYNGVTMAEFQSRTGMLPVDAYPVSEGRVFVFRTEPVYMTLAATHVTPAITRSSQCQLLIRAVHFGEGQTADNWRIMGTERSGPCNNLPI